MKKNQLKIVIFYSREKMQYISWACFRNELQKLHMSEPKFRPGFVVSLSLTKHTKLRRVFLSTSCFFTGGSYRQVKQVKILIIFMLYVFW